ncbi:MAG TPA: kynureninase [Myxococcaceae bacterium]|nr:kynureninase [Myxococcaceae bacterium]
MTFEDSEAFARGLDAADLLARFRGAFHIPKGPDGRPCLYLAGNSLGLQPHRARHYIEEALDDWARLGVEGHLHARSPWLPYHERLTASTARLVGALPEEVVVMNTLTVNLHLMMVSFYRPTRERFRVLMEADAFPSDRYAVASQVRYHGHSPEEAVVEVKPRPGEDVIRPGDLRAAILREGPRLALVLVGNVNYLTGQAFDVRALTEAAHAVEARVGFDLAHGAGNLRLRLHDDGPDFAVWCSYKYLNGGPGSLGGVFVHSRHSQDRTLPRFEGWWGHDKSTRFDMPARFHSLPGAEGWQLSNPPILQLAALRASMELFAEAGMAALVEKRNQLTGYLEFLLAGLPPGVVKVITPRDPEQRGSQLSLRVAREARGLVTRLGQAGAVVDFRAPDVVRAAPVPLYNSYMDAWRFARILHEHASA